MTNIQQIFLLNKFEDGFFIKDEKCAKYEKKTECDYTLHLKDHNNNLETSKSDYFTFHSECKHCKTVEKVKGI